MEIIGGVTAVPFGLLACRIDGREVQITEIGENGFAFRTAEPIAMEKNEDHRIEVSFYHMVQGQYETVRIRGIQRSPVITLEREERWYRVYSVDVQQEDYRREVRELVLWYDRYIRLKCTCDDGELAGHLTGYPAELDEGYGKSFEEQKENWFGAVVTDSSNMTDRVGFADCALPAAKICGREVMAVVEGMELAVELDGPKWYDCYLKEKLSEVSRQYWDAGGLGKYPLAKRLPDRIYIGNQFCPCLFPTDEQLFRMLEKAERDGLSVTVVTDSSNMTDRVGFADCALPAAKICGREVMAVVEGMELAVELDGPKWYDCYLKEKLSEVSRQYWDAGGLGKYPLAKRLPDRIYIGNQFCPCLFPTDEQLFRMLEKAERDGLSVTVVFPYMAEGAVGEMKKLLTQLDQWCQKPGIETHVNPGKNRHLEKLELVINDLGMVVMAEELKLKNLTLSMGTLLNRRRKDPRMVYKLGKKELFNENSLNAEFYRQYVRNEWNIHRVEWESCGYQQNIGGRQDFFGDDAGIASSIHIPYYQTNTSEYCTLYAICANGDRGKQNRVEHCPHYCEKYAFLYPDHLKMIGKGNSLFAFDLEILRNQEILRNYREQGVDRLVIHLL